MGGMGFIENNKALCMLSVLTNTHMLVAAKEAGIHALSFTPLQPAFITAEKQTDANVTPTQGRRRPTPRFPKTATAGRSSSPSACAAILKRITA